MEKNKDIEIVQVLMQDAQAKVSMAIADIKIILNNPVGVGDHPNVLETIQVKLDELSKYNGRLNTLTEYFYEEN